MKRCPFCAEEIQEAAVVCKHCGRDLQSSEQPRRPNPDIDKHAGPSTTRRVVGAVTLVVIVSALLVVIRSSNRRAGGDVPEALRATIRLTIGDGQPTELPSTGYSDYSFDLPARRCTVTGRILGIAGGNKDFQAFITDDDDFLNWKTSHNARAVWQTEKVAAATVNATVSGPGKFHLVISNVFSLMTAKTVTVQGVVTCP